MNYLLALLEVEKKQDDDEIVLLNLHLRCQRCVERKVA